MTEEDRMEGLRLLEAWACGDENSRENFGDWLLEHARALLDDGWRGIETAPNNQYALVFAGGQALVAFNNDGGWMQGGFYVPYVTHWRPLPPPPETKP